MAPFIQTSNVAVSASGATTVATNPYKVGPVRGQSRGAVLRVFSFNIQNQNTTAQVQASWIDSSGTTIAGPFIIPVSFGNWTERASAPAFLFETTRASNGLGYDLQVSLNQAVACQVFVEWGFSFVPGRVGG